MRKIILVAIVSLVLSSISFADSKDECRMIAKSCVKAGFTMKQTSGKEFWHNCMKPLLMGEKVNGITIPADTITTCRQAKITEMQQELKDLQSVNTTTSQTQ